MPSKLGSPSKLHTLFHALALLLTILVVTWFAIIIWWQISERIVSLKDANLYLIALPLGISACIGFLRRKLVVKHNTLAPTADQLAEPGMPSSSSEIESHTSNRAVKLPILAAWAITSLGTNGDEFVDKLNERRNRPVPDSLLSDEQGFPVLTGRVEYLDTSIVTHHLRQTDANDALESPFVPEEAHDRLLRALALLERILEQVAQEWPLPATDTENSPAKITPTLGGVLSPVAGSTNELSLRVKLLISEELEPHEKDAVQAYLKRRLTAYKIPVQRLIIDVIAAEDDISALMLADEFRIEALDTCHTESPQALLLLATSSVLCSTITDRWGTEGRLFNPRRPNGLMPGEAAFGVLCTDEKTLQIASEAPICYMGRVIRAQCETDTAINNSHGCLVEAIGATLDASDISGDIIGTVVCDADHRTSRTLESIEAMVSQTPRLDAIQNRLAINEACGHLGAASVLGVLATGVIQSGNTGRPVLLFNVSHPAERAAVILAPADSQDGVARSQQLQAA